MITEPTGNSPLAQWLRKLAREVNSQRLTSVFGGRFVRGAQGTQIIVEPPLRKPGEAGTVTAYKVQSEGDNHLSVKLWVSGSEVGSALNIAKPPYLRLASKPSSGHIIFPGYTGAVVYGSVIEGGTDVTVSSVPLTIMDVNADARNWAYEVDFCDGGVEKSAYVVMGAAA